MKGEMKIKFGSVLEGLKEGKRYARKRWGGLRSIWICYTPVSYRIGEVCEEEFFLAKYVCGAWYLEWTPKIEDLFADDWICLFDL